MLLSSQVTSSFPTSLNSIAVHTRIWSETKSRSKKQALISLKFSFVLINLYFWLYINSIWLLLLRSGDIETNPGPIKSIKDIFLDCETYSDNLKFLHLNVRSITRKQLQLKSLMNDVGANCIYGLSETWLDTKIDTDLVNPDKKNCLVFRNDLVSSKGGGVLLIVPRKLNPKLRLDLAFKSTLFDTLWVEITCPKIKKVYLINISYNPKKLLYEEFLEQSARSIDRAITENKTIIMMGDYNINYLENKEKQNLETIIQPYDLNVTNKHQATRIKDESNSLIDYIIIDGNEPLLYNEIFDSPIQTDHFAQLIILATKLSKNKVIKKQIYDKTNYSPIDFKHSIKQLNWENFYCSTAPSEMLRTFEQNLEQQILLHAPIKTIFIRNNKSQFSLAKRFISKNTRNKNLLREQYLNSESFHEFFKLKAEVCAGYEKDFEKFHNQLIESSTSERKKWNLINEVRNSVKTTTTVYSLKTLSMKLLQKKLK